MMFLKSAAPALTAALLFGASTPLAKLLSGEMPALLLAGLMYLGSGMGLALVMLARFAIWRTADTGLNALRIPATQRPWLIGAIMSGGVIGPVLLMTGLHTTDGASASLLLNLEGVLTALMAWVVFRENAGRSTVMGMAAIVLGGVLLSWHPGQAALSGGALLILGACACWAVDNNLTRKVSTNDAMLIACLKGLAAGVCNTMLALTGGSALPATGAIVGAMAVGFAGYGLSLVLFVVALRTLGTARTGAYFSVAPLFGVVISLLIWPAAPGLMFWLASVLMAAGIWLHVRERHAHPHLHEPHRHTHRHRHDDHHQHVHPEGWDGTEPHTHAHTHAKLEHSHPHFPDVHHWHGHSH